MPRAGERFLGAYGRTRARVRERRRRIFVVLLEGVALTGLIGLFPPLRSMWFVTAGLAVVLAAYVWLLVQLRAQELGVPDRSAEPIRHASPNLSIPAADDGGRHIVVLPGPGGRRSRVAG